MNVDFINALEEIEKEKGITKDIIFDALESALISSFKKNFGSSQNVLVEMNRGTGAVKVFATKDVVESDLLEDSLPVANLQSRKNCHWIELITEPFIFR